MSDNLITGEQLAKFINETYPEASASRGFWRGDAGDDVDPWQAYADYTKEWARDALRLDDGQTAVFAESLEHIIAQTIDKRYPALRAREFIPISTEASPGATSIAVVGYEGRGSATRLATYGEDIRTVDVRAGKAPIPVVGSAVGWRWTLQQMRSLAQAQSKGFPTDINQKGIDTARLVVLRDIDSLLAAGESDSGVEGFCQLSSVAAPLAAGGLITGAWAGGITTVAQILADILYAIGQIESTGVWMADTFLIPPSVMRYLAVTEIASGSGISLLKWIRDQLAETNPGLTIQSWIYLETAGAGGVTRGVMYMRDRAVVEGYLPVDVEALPPWQDSPMSYLNVFHARCAGCHAANPSGMIYLDGI